MPDILKSFDDAISAGRILPDAPENAFTALTALEGSCRRRDYLVQENRLRVALEDQGQQVLLQYLKGDQVPQTRDDFLKGAALFSTARLLTPESLLLEAREISVSAEPLCLRRTTRRLPTCWNARYVSTGPALIRTTRWESRIWSRPGTSRPFWLSGMQSVARPGGLIRFTTWLLPTHN